MNPSKLLVGVFLLFFAIYASAAVTETIVVSPSTDGNYLRGTQAIVFTVTTNNSGDTPTADLYYSTSIGAHTNVIESALPLDDTNCGDTDFSTPNTCVYSWDTTAATDGNYFVDVNVTVTGSGIEDSSDNDFVVDNTAPTTSVDYNSGWTRFDNTVTLTGTDNSNNLNTYFRQDSDPTDNIIGDWALYSAAFTISTDGNFTVDFNSIDAAGNQEISQRIYVLIDTVVPTISNLVPASGSQSSSQIVTFNLFDGNSGIDLSTARVDINGTTSTSFVATTHCNLSGDTYICSYSESTFDTNNTDYNVTVFAFDQAGNAATQAETVFTYIDSGAPAQVTGLAATAGDAQVALSWTANSESDLNHYNVYMGTSSGFTTDASALIAVVSAGTVTYTKTGLTNGTQYFFKVSAEDNSGNEGADSTEASATPDVNASGLSAPAISSSTHTHDVWSSNNNPEFSWDTVSGADYYSYEFNQTSDTVPANTSDTTGTSFSPSGTQAEGIWYFHLRACKSSGCSSTSRFNVKIDRTGPQQPPNFDVSANPDGSVDIDWGEADDRPSGDNSGVKEYKIYRKLNDDAPDDSDVIRTTTSTSYNDDDPNLSDGVRYYYWVRAFDEAGNAGAITGVKSVIITKGEGCNLDFSYDLASHVKTGELKFEITASGTMTDPELKIRIVGVGLIPEESINYRNTSVEATYTLDENFDGKELEITLTADDSSGDSCFFRETFSIDGGNPTLEWVDPLEGADIDLSEQTSFTVKALDEQSSVVKVVFYYKQNGSFEKIGEDTSSSNDEFSISVSSLDVSIGELELKAEAIDRAGNKTEKTITANVTNAPGGQSIYEQKEFEFDQGKLGDLLKEAGLQEELVEEAKEFIENNTVKRKFLVIKTGEESFRAKIVVTFVNESQNTSDIKIVEVVPKSFAQSASMLSSVDNFTVIEEDPVIEFTFSDVEPGEKIEVEYALKEVLTQEQADALIVKQPIQDFASPPIVLQADKDLSKSFAKTPFEFDLIFILFIVIIIILIALVGLAIFGGGLIFHLHRKSREETPSLRTKIQKMGPGPMERTSEQLRDWFKEREREQRPGGRFRWKGK